MDKLKKYIYELVADRKLSAKEATAYITSLQKASEAKSDDIAIIGIAGRFPKANTVQQFWENIRFGRECLDDFPVHRKEDGQALFSDRSFAYKRFKKAGYLDEISFFDPDMFRISPKEALSMEPYQRIMLELAYETMLNAGYETREIIGSKTGVFIGKDHVTGIEYRHYVSPDIFSLTGSWPGILASRISYVYNLKGPSIVFDTSCSSGLVGVHFACESLRRNECEMAFVGGISGLFYFPPVKEDGSLDQVESAEEKIRAFDKEATGTVWGEGGGGLLLKPLSRALADNDVIYAVIKGSGINNNGLSKGITAPNGEAQEALLKSVWKQAQINPETIRYIEAHGTGTVLGDSIELQSIINAFQAFTSKKQFCGVGSVKTNIGHLVGASGIVSLIKAVMMLRHGEIPPSLHFQSPSPYMDLTNSAVFVNDALTKWEQQDQPVRIGINSFGFSGTNCHVLLEEPPKAVRQASRGQDSYLLVLSARSEQKLQELAKQYQQFLLANRDVHLGDLCFTASASRHHYAHRATIVFDSYEDLLVKVNELKTANRVSAWTANPAIRYQRHEVVPDNKQTVEAWEIRERAKKSLDRQANEAIKEWIGKTSDQRLIWEQVAPLYIQGATIDWGMLYCGGRKLALPGNILERQKFWPAGAQPKKAEADFLYQVAWKEEALPATDSEQQTACDTVLLIVDAADTAIWRALFLQKHQARRLVTVELGARSAQVAPDYFQVSRTLDDIAAFCAQLDLASLAQIVFMPPARAALPESLAAFRSAMEQTAGSLLLFAKALATTGKLANEIDVVLLTQNAQAVQPGDAACDPFHHMLGGLGKSLRQENYGLSVRHIDISPDGFAPEPLFAELGRKGTDYSVALRQNRRYIEIIERAKQTGAQEDSFAIEAGDVFLLTGGLGQLGTEVCKYLSQKNKVKLIVLGKTMLPDRETWPAVLRESPDISLADKINAVLAVEALGSTLDYHCADICDEAQLQRTVQAIRQTHQRLAGVIHCAGIGVGELEDAALGEAEFARRHAVKTDGSWLLYTLTQEIDTGFYLFFSSAVSVTGGRGALGYATGNAFLDGWAEAIRRQGKKVFSINWATWEETAERLSMQEERHVFSFLPTHQALQALDSILRRQMFRTIVGQFNQANELLELAHIWPFRLADEVKKDVFRQTAKPGRAAAAPVPVTLKEQDGFTATQKELAQVWAEVLGLSSISLFDTFHQLGGDSIHAAQLYKQWNEKYPGTLHVADLYLYPTIFEMANYLDGKKVPEPAALTVESILEGYKTSKYSQEETKRLLEQWTAFSAGETAPSEQKDEYAIIGYACQFPLAENAEQFWTNLTAGVNAIRPFPASRRKDTDRFLSATQTYCQGGYLEQIDRFDSAFFHIAPKEAGLMDPEQRLLLQNVYEALETSGLGGKSLFGTKTGVYIGKDTTGRNEYNNMIDIQHPLKVTSGSTGILASRIAYFLNLKGPCLVVDTACSSSLAALCLAAQALQAGQIDVAIVAGVSLAYLPTQHNSLIDSADETIRPFDAQANGTMWGEGVGTIVLKQLDQAVRDNHAIHAVVKGSAMNNNGASNGITAPNAEAQEKALVEAWQAAKIDPETITYLEAHATGTRLGDPIELKGIANAFRRFTDKKQFCGVGTVKANIGHLVGASGMASVIKMILAFKHGQLPPVANFRQPNPFIEFADSPVYVNDKLQKWRAAETPRRCGISSFGFSGTNCHVLLEEPPASTPAKRESSPGWQLLALSAKTKSSLRALLSRYARYLNETPAVDVPDLCYTANATRGHYEHRVAILFRDQAELREKCKYADATGLEHTQEAAERGIFYKASRVIVDENDPSENGIMEEEKVKRTALAERTIRQYKENGTAFALDSLQNIAAMYTDGADIEWQRLYAKEQHHIIALPAYPYEAVRHWIGTGPQNSEGPAQTTDTCYRLHWVRDDKATAPLRQAGAKPGTWLFLSGTGYRSHELLVELQAREADVIEVAFGAAFEKGGDHQYKIGSADDFPRLLQELAHRDIRHIVHCMGMTEEKLACADDFHEWENRSVYSFCQLVCELLNQSYHQEINLYLLGDQAFSVTRREAALNPQHAVLFGLAKVVAQEYPQLKCRCIDLDSATAPSTLWAEWEAGEEDFQVAYRENVRYVERLEAQTLQAAEPQAVSIRENGVYLVTGGLGDIGLQVAHYLGNKQPVHLCLLARSAFPAREQWAEIVREQPHSALAGQIGQIRSIEDSGSSVEVHTVDVADERRLADVLQTIRQQYGAIHGVFHCAGVAGEGLLINKGRAKIAQVLAPKVVGTWLLDRYTEQDRLDFFVLFSSVTSLLGGLGQADYTAANAYLDAFSDYRQAKGRQSVTINWPAWNDTGMAARYRIQKEASPFCGMHPDKAIGILDAVLRRKLARVIVGELNEAHFQTHRYPLPFAISPEIRSMFARPVAWEPETADATPLAPMLTGRTDHTYSAVETRLAAVWQKVLGIPEANVYQSFQEAGGNSILATSLVKEIEQLYPGRINIATLFAYPSIAKMAEYLENKPSAHETPRKAGQSETVPLQDKLSDFLKGNVSMENILDYLDQKEWGEEDE
ncbi:SDR family oxidoreductase [Brevibacillus sp. NSP2.1]|uniref:SDR family oxidoreductase n=1 Tax=Brevibacillus sp. NSP2.1 TaxID=3003229 RepID=UPI000554F17F|nr:SDR family oxidoreductase [Brevibacillus sp. NSP2.1]QHZ56581.1 SDR family oxidoreductase [Brevibacillus sp. NSP2.1]